MITSCSIVPRWIHRMWRVSPLPMDRIWTEQVSGGDRPLRGTPRAQLPDDGRVPQHLALVGPIPVPARLSGPLRGGGHVAETGLRAGRLVRATAPFAPGQ